MNRLLDCHLRYVLMKWIAGCPYFIILLASSRKIDSRRTDGLSKTEGLNDADLEDEEDESRYFFFAHSFLLN